MKKTIFDEFVARCETNDQLDILYLLQDSDKDHRVKRWELVDKLHRRDEVIRANIEKMRENGIFIAAENGAAGYYLPSSYAEYLIFEESYVGRAKTILSNRRKMRRMANELLSGQERMAPIK